MDNKQLEEEIKALKDLADASPTAEIEITLEDKDALIFAISILKLCLSVSKEMPKKKDFEDYLMDIHGKQYVGTDDNMPDDFNKWVENLDIDELIEYADKFNNLCHDEFTAWLAGRMEGRKIQEIFLNIAKRVQVDDKENPGHWRWAWIIDYDDLATAIKKYILEKGEKQ